MLLEQERRAAETARLLHDEAGATLSAVGFHVSALRADAETTAELTGYLEQVIETVRKAQNQLITNRAERSGLGLALELLAGRWREQGLAVDLRIEGARRFPAPVTHAVYRMVELAVDNAHRHAGTGAVAISLSTDDAGLEVLVEDHGQGFDLKAEREAPSGTGLILMEAYARSASLHLRVASTRKRGTIVKIQT